MTSQVKLNTMMARYSIFALLVMLVMGVLLVVGSSARAAAALAASGTETPTPLVLALATSGPRNDATPTGEPPTITAVPADTVEPTITAAPADTPLPTVAVASGPAFGLAWFHKPPTDGTSAAQLAAQMGYIHLTGAADIPYRDELRAAGYTGPIYSYTNATSVEGPGPYKSSADACDSEFQPHDNNLASNKGDFCTFIHPNESWFLHNGAGERLVLDYFGTGIWSYLMNPADPGWQQYSYERLEQAHDSLGYSGIWLDNLDTDLDRGRYQMKNSDGWVKEFTGDSDFRKAMAGWLLGARVALGGWPIWANLVSSNYAADSWDDYAPYLDGAMEESFSVRWIDNWLRDANWKTQLQRAERWQAQGKGLVMVGQGPQDDTERMRFTLASYMLVAQPGEGFFRYTRYDSYYNSLWLYPEYDTARQLGAPLGPRREVRAGIWQRHFSGGYVEVDLNTHTGKLVPN